MKAQTVIQSLVVAALTVTGALLTVSAGHVGSGTFNTTTISYLDCSRFPGHYEVIHNNDDHGVVFVPNSYNALTQQWEDC